MNPLYATTSPSKTHTGMKSASRAKLRNSTSPGVPSGSGSSAEFTLKVLHGGISNSNDRHSVHLSCCLQMQRALLLATMLEAYATESTSWSSRTELCDQSCAGCSCEWGHWKAMVSFAQLARQSLQQL
jgi:hypothetical protein